MSVRIISSVAHISRYNGYFPGEKHLKYDRFARAREGRGEGGEGLVRAGGCKDAAAPNARFVSTRATFV